MDGRDNPRIKSGDGHDDGVFKPHRSVFAILLDPNFGSDAALNFGRADAGGPSTEPQTARALSERSFQSGAAGPNAQTSRARCFVTGTLTATAVASRHRPRR